MTLGQFHLTGKVQQATKDGADSGIDQDTTVATGWTATLTSNYPKGVPIPDGSDIDYIDSRTVTLLPDGSITEDGVNAGISLTAHDPAVFATALQWTIKPGTVTLTSGKTLRPKEWTFNAPLNGMAVTLGGLTPVAGIPLQPAADTVPWDSVSGKPLVIGAGPTATDARAAINAAAEYLYHVDAYGALGDGSTNDRAALVAADTAALAAGVPVYFPKGTYRVATSLTVASPVAFAPGAVIKPSSGQTVTLTGGVTAPLSKIFDHSLGGLVVPKNVDFYRPQWWDSVGTANDSSAWTAMAAALNASVSTFSGVAFGQRVLAPAGINRIIGVTLSNCEIHAGRGVCLFLPPAATTSGVMLTLGDYSQLNGGFFGTDVSTQAVTCIYQPGYRSQVDDVFIANAAANSVGLQMGLAAAGSTTPVANNVRINSGLATPASGSIGLDIQSSDAELTNVWVAQNDIGIKGTLAGACRMANVHVWGNNTGITGNGWDASQFTNVYLDTNRGWGIDVDRLDRVSWQGIYAANNGGAIGSTGGIRLTQSTGSAQRCIMRGVFLDDNVGTGLKVVDTVDYEIEVILSSSAVQQGNPVVTTTGVDISSGTDRLKLSLRGTDATTPLVNGSSSTILVTDPHSVLVYDGAATLTLSKDVDVYVGQRSSAATWTLPPVAGAGVRFVLKNASPAVITVNSANVGSEFIYDSSGAVALVGSTFNLQPYGDAVEIMSDGAEWGIISRSGTHSATGKTTPVDADELPLSDSAASFGLKKLTYANLKAALAAYYATLTVTETNKRSTPRIGTVASSATPTVNTDNVDQFNITALAAAITSMTTNLSGTPTDGQCLDVRFKDNGTGRAITWGATFTGTLLSTTIANKTHLQRLKWDAAAAKWAGYSADTAGY